MDVIFILVGSVIGSEVYLWIKHRLKYKYHWKCPNCTLSISSSTKDMIDIVKENHTDHSEN